MTSDILALQSKRQEVSELIAAAAAKASSLPIGVDHVMRAFAFTAPALDEGGRTYGLVTARFTGTSRSIKPGNILLRWNKLLDKGSDAMIAAAGAGAPKWLLPAIGIYVLRRLLDAATEPLSDVEATVMMALWENREATLAGDAGFTKTNDLRRDNNLPVLSRRAYEEAISRLLQIRCLEMSAGVIALRESVHVSYA